MKINKPLPPARTNEKKLEHDKILKSKSKGQYLAENLKYLNKVVLPYSQVKNI